MWMGCVKSESIPAMIITMTMMTYFIKCYSVQGPELSILFVLFSLINALLCEVGTNSISSLQGRKEGI